MIEQEIIKRTIKDYDIIFVKCDWCKKTWKKPQGQPYGEINITFGYGSEYDCIEGERYIAEICDNCFKKIFLKKTRYIGRKC
jgi:hypothetical protein